MKESSASGPVLVTGMASDVEIKIGRILAAAAAFMFMVLGVAAFPAISQTVISHAADGEVLHGYMLGLSAAFVVNAGLVLVAGYKIPGRWWKRLALLTSIALLGEVSLAGGIYYLGNIPHTGTYAQQRIFGGFVFHPALGGVPKPNYRFKDRDIEIVHSPQGFRGTAVDPGEPKTKTRIITVGGSTTYDIGVSNHETWPKRLEEALGDDVEVINFGMPAHSTAEHVILTSLRISEFNPDIILFYVGWNDLRMSHTRVLRPDYSAFQMRRHYSVLGIDTPYRPIATMTVLNLMRQFIPNTLYAISKAAKGDGPISGEVDERLLSYFKRNIRLLAAAARSLDATPIFIPQVLNIAAMTSDSTGGWVRNIPQKHVPAVMAVFNKAMMDTASSESADGIGEVLDYNWSNGHFFDDGHFSPSGSAAFSKIVAGGLRARGLVR